jgi:hypothetical protein
MIDPRKCDPVHIPEFALVAANRPDLRGSIEVTGEFFMHYVNKHRGMAVRGIAVSGMAACVDREWRAMTANGH